MESNEDIVKRAVRDACPDPDNDCLSDEEECFNKHPIHEGGSTDGVIDSIYADVDGLAFLIVKALADSGRLRDA